MDKEKIIKVYLRSMRAIYDNTEGKSGYGLALKELVDSDRCTSVRFYYNDEPEVEVARYTLYKLSIECENIKYLDKIERALNTKYDFGEEIGYNVSTRRGIMISILLNSDKENIEIGAFSNIEKLVINFCKSAGSKSISVGNLIVKRRGVNNGKLVIDSKIEDIDNVNVDYIDGVDGAKEIVNISSHGGRKIKSVCIEGNKKVILQSLYSGVTTSVDKVYVKGMKLHNLIDSIIDFKSINQLVLEDNELKFTYGHTESQGLRSYLREKRIKLIGSDGELGSILKYYGREADRSSVVVDNYDDGYKAYNRASMLGTETLVIVNDSCE